MTHSAKRGVFGLENLIFPEESDPFRHISCLAEGGVPCIICYTGRVFWPSANWPPWRKGGQVAISHGRQTDLRGGVVEV
jgi:hypothetical protein